MVAGAIHDLRVQAWFWQGTPFQQLLNLGKTLCVFLTPLRKVHYSFSQGRASGGYNYAGGFQILQGSLTVCGCLLSSPRFRMGTSAGVFWLTRVGCCGSECPRDCGWTVLLSLPVTVAASYHLVLPSGLTSWIGCE